MVVPFNQHLSKSTTKGQAEVEAKVEKSRI